jgi:hypothetical protein
MYVIDGAIMQEDIACMMDSCRNWMVEMESGDIGKFDLLI